MHASPENGETQAGDLPDQSPAVGGMRVPMALTEDALKRMAGHPLELVYVDASGIESHRFVTPLGFTTVHGRPALRAHCHMRKEERCFLVSRIRSCHCTVPKEAFKIDVGINGEPPRIPAAVVTAVAVSLRGQSAWDDLSQQSKRREAASACASARLWRTMWILSALLCVGAFAYGTANMTPASVSVSGYTRRDGTRISGYNRRPSGSRAHDLPYGFIRVISFFGFCGSLFGAFHMHGVARRKRREEEALRGPSSLSDAMPRLVTAVNNAVDTAKQINNSKIAIYGVLILWLVVGPIVYLILQSLGVFDKN